MLRGAEVRLTSGWVYSSCGGISYDVAAFIAGDINEIVGSVWADDHVLFAVRGGAAYGYIAIAVYLRSGDFIAGCGRSSAWLARCRWIGSTRGKCGSNSAENEDVGCFHKY